MQRHLSSVQVRLNSAKIQEWLSPQLQHSGIMLAFFKGNYLFNIYNYCGRYYSPLLFQLKHKTTTPKAQEGKVQKMIKWQH